MDDMKGMLALIVALGSTEQSAEARRIYESVGMKFVQNVGQTGRDVVFYSMHPQVVRILKDGTIRIKDVEIKMGKPRFIVGDLRIATKVSYFGRGKKISDIPTYKTVVMKEVYPQIDAVITALEGGNVELQFVVNRGGDPEDIRLKIKGGRIKLKEDGLYVGEGIIVLIPLSYRY